MTVATEKTWSGNWLVKYRNATGGTITVRWEGEDEHGKMLSYGWTEVSRFPRLTGQSDAIKASACGWTVTAASGNMFLYALEFVPFTDAADIRSRVGEYRKRHYLFGSLLWHAR